MAERPYRRGGRRPPLRGLGVSPGAGAGPVRRIAGRVPEPPAGERDEGAPEAAIAAATAALEETAVDLEARADGAVSSGGAAEILGAQALMARDPAVTDDVSRRIRGGTSAARAVYEAFGTFREMLASAGGYLAERAADLDDIRDRAVARLLGIPQPGVPQSADPYVLVGRDLAPADTAMIDPSTVVAFATAEGGPTSHTAILARAIGVPAVVACPGADQLAEGTLVLVDGDAGTVTVEPGPEEVTRARWESAEGVAAAAAMGPGQTADGHRVALLANIGGPADLPAAVEAGAEGIGLYRTEFLFLGRASAPDEDEQAQVYQEALAAFPGSGKPGDGAGSGVAERSGNGSGGGDGSTPGGPVVVRVLDAGADKPLGFLPPPAAEPNPALGERGLRMLQLHPEVLDTQLRALVRAASRVGAGGGQLEVMAPMVADAEDAAWFARRCRDAGISHPGVMIEIPGAALRAADLAAEVEFFSIGTNDLAQYAAAADREAAGLARLQDPWQPMVLDLIAVAAAAAAAAGKPCGVCGEAAADPALACVLAGLGVTSLSMTPRALPRVRAALASRALADCQAAAEKARRAVTAAAARDAARAIIAPGT
jgi:phosphoenolpyruvate-protein phosphotransferase (PTS system enzyme I)